MEFLNRRGSNPAATAMVSNDEWPPQHVYLSHLNYQCAYHPYIQNLVKKRWEPGEDEGPESARERPMSQEDKVGWWLVLGGLGID